ncbi:MAG: hypothetical protein ABI769_04845 [Pseudomonadota bacterium]
MTPEINRDLYKIEMEQRWHLIEAAIVPILAITVLSSGLLAMLLGFPYAGGALSAAFVGFAGMAGVGVAVAIGAVFRAFIGYHYERPASPRSWQTYFDTLLAHYAGVTGQLGLARAALERAFHTRLADATHANRRNNRRRSNSIFLANLSCAGILVALVASGVCYALAAIAQNSQLYAVRIGQ